MEDFDDVSCEDYYGDDIEGYWDTGEDDDPNPYAGDYSEGDGA